MTDLEILQGAHALLSRRNGWIQNCDSDIIDGTVAFCLRGAVREMEVFGFGSVKQRLAETIFATFPDDPSVRGSLVLCGKPLSPWFWDGVITAFNDANERRKKDILRVLEVAIADEQARLAEHQEGGATCPS